MKPLLVILFQERWPTPAVLHDALPGATASKSCAVCKTETNLFMEVHVVMYVSAEGLLYCLARSLQIFLGSSGGEIACLIHNRIRMWVLRSRIT